MMCEPTCTNGWMRCCLHRGAKYLIPIVMEKNFSSLLSKLCEIRLDYRRINDVTFATGALSLAFYDYKDAAGKVEVRLCLKDAKSNEYSLSERQLAALRIEVGELKAIWLDEFKTDPEVVVFQTIAREYLATSKSIETIKFTVSKQLKVKNNQITDSVQPVFQDVCYAGILEYKKGIVSLLDGKDNSFFLTAEYSRGMTALRATLHATPLKPGRGTEKDIVLLPVFKLS
jgi:hypothetical protein